MGTQSDFRVKKNLIVGDGTISSGDNANLVLRRDFDDTTYNQITLNDDNYKITLDGSDRFYIDGAGKVGLGTTSPSERLDIRNSATPKLLVRTTATSSQEAHIIIGGARTTSTTADISRVIFDTYDSDIGGSESNTLAEITVRKQAASSDQGNLLFKTNSGDNNISEAMRIDKDGNVGIGTTSPSSKLHVSGDTTIYNGTSEAHLILRRDATGTNYGSAIKWRFGDSGSSSSGHEYARITGNIQDSTDGSEDGYLTLQTSRDGTLTEAIRINKDGEVGIGTTSPSDALHIRAASDHPLVIENTTNAAYAGIQFSDNSTGSYAQKGEFRFNHADASSEGSGASFHFTTTESDLSIVGGKFISAVGSASEPGFSFSGDTNVGMFRPATNELAFSVVNEAMRIDSNANVGIGTTSPGNILDVEESVDGNAQIRIENTNSGGTSNVASVGIVSDGNNLSIASYGDSHASLANYNRITTSASGSVISIDSGTVGEGILVADGGNVGIGTTTPGYALDIQRADAKINLKDTSDTDDMFVRFQGSDSNEYGLVGYNASSVFQIKSTQGRVINIGGHANVKVGVTTADMTFTPSALFHVNGALKATTKSFDIEHPTKEGMRLHHGVLEGPEHGVYIRGHQVGETIELPDYWLGLVDEDTITVQLTAKGRTQNLYVKSVDREKVVVGGFITKSPDFYYFIQAERKDIDKMVVEY